MKITTKQVSNGPVTFVTHKRFAILFFPSTVLLRKLTDMFSVFTLLIPWTKSHDLARFKWNLFITTSLIEYSLLFIFLKSDFVGTVGSKNLKL